MAESKGSEIKRNEIKRSENKMAGSKFGAIFDAPGFLRALSRHISFDLPA